MTGDRTPSPFLTTEFTEGVGAQFSPDGRWVAYTSNESGRQEVYVASFPVPSSKWPVSTNGGLHSPLEGGRARDLSTSKRATAA